MPFADTHAGPAGLKARPQAFFRSGSVVSALPGSPMSAGTSNASIERTTISKATAKNAGSASRIEMRITATDLSELGCIDDIVPEPDGGAHRDHEAAAALLDASLQKHYAELKKIPAPELLVSRYNKFRNIAQFYKTGS